MEFTSKSRLITWTETARLQLIEAVIKVEVEMISEWNKAGRHPGRKRAANWNMMRSAEEKWIAIADLLPAELREKTWNSQKQMYNKPKCYTHFHNLIKVYRDKLGGKETICAKLELTEPVRRILKRREDLINGRHPAPEKGSSRLVKKMSVDTSSSQGDVNHQKHISPASKYDLCQIRPLSNTDTSRINMRASEKIGQINWTEATRLQLIEAVIKVEKDMMTELNGEGGWSTDNPKEKWDRIADLLPPEMRGRIWRCRSRTNGQHKCSNQFYYLLAAYRDKLAGKATRSCVLTELVVKLLKRREDFLNARCILQERGSSTSAGSKSVDTSEISNDDEEQLSPNRSNSSKGQSMCSVKGRRTAWSSGHTDELESTDTDRNTVHNMEREKGTHVNDDALMEKDAEYSSFGSRPVYDSKHQEKKFIPAPQNSITTSAQARPQTRTQGRAKTMASESATRGPSTDCRASLPDRKCDSRETFDIRDNGGNHIDQGTFRDRRNADSGYEARSSYVFEDSQSQSEPAGFLPGSASLSASESENLEDSSMAKPLPTGRSGAQTQAQTRSHKRGLDSLTRPSSHNSRGSSSARKSTTSMTHTKRNEHAHAIFDGPLRRLDLEYYRLRSWVQSQSVLFGKNLANKISSSKRSKSNFGTASEDKILSTMIDLRIRASFPKLRVDIQRQIDIATEGIFKP